MADEESAGEKTHEPTGKKLEEAREKGNVPKSQDLFGLVSLAVGVGMVLVFQGLIGRRIMVYTQMIYDEIPNNNYSHTEFFELLYQGLMAIAKVILPILISLAVVSVVLGMIQMRFIIPKEPIKFNWKTLDPISGIKRKFLSIEPLVEMAKGLLKLVLLGFLVWEAISDRLFELPSLINATPSEQILFVTDLAYAIFWRALIVGVLAYILDYAYSWYKIRQELMMTHQEIKDEYKDSEGDPLLKGKRKQRQYEIAMGTFMQKVPESDVVLTNPTHFAVALRYRKEEAEAPVLLVKGVDFLAFRIRSIAKSHDILIVENPPLARALYYNAKEGQMIPPEFYSAVAEILAMVYRKRYRSLL